MNQTFLLWAAAAVATVAVVALAFIAVARQRQRREEAERRGQAELDAVAAAHRHALALAAERAAAQEAARLASERAARLAEERHRQLAAEHAAAAELAARRRAEEEAAALMRHRAAEQAAAEAAHRAAEAAAAAAAAPPPRPRAPEDTLVMVADDSKVVRVKTSRLLAQHRYRVVLAEDGAEAARLIEQEVPMVLITDVEMPGMDGFALTRHVRAHPRASHIPIIMITSADDRLKAAAEDAGVTLVLGKPYPEETLLACIERAQGVSTV